MVVCSLSVSVGCLDLGLGLGAGFGLLDAGLDFGVAVGGSYRMVGRVVSGLNSIGDVVVVAMCSIWLRLVLCCGEVERLLRLWVREMRMVAKYV